MGESIRLTAREARVINAMRKNTGAKPVAQGAVVANVVLSATAPRTFATKAERAAGNGFPCPQCARNDLRVAPKSGSFHEKDAKTDAREKVICTIA